MTNKPQILALDFDGVLCDGLAEYFQTSKITYGQIWDSPSISDDFEPAFRRLRPVIETGWEMPLLLRALVLGISQERILENWGDVSQELIASEKLEAKAIADKLDTVRDKWIKSDLESWLALHQFYPGVVAKLQQILDAGIKIDIVTTKEGRFVQELLKKAGISLDSELIIGKECKQPKHQTLRQLLHKNACEPQYLWFVEDRLKTLQSVQKQSDLQEVGLFLATWGYNTQSTQALARNDLTINLLSVEQFKQDFDQWK